ncbi:MAG: hypothetical protein LQ342_003898 [Letrouitia transgressa]|nr:MAG: hypothetical protein LQ342_003898 [Letrouitia transgressa]
MSGSKLDQVVKGAPPPGTVIPPISSRSPSPDPSSGHAESQTSRPTARSLSSDPLAALPSSPPQIYLNLLILEASLRMQYLTLRARRRQHTFFLLILALWNIGFFYALFLRPREDGSGVGGSVYWVIEITEKVALMGGVVTGILLWGTGQWDRGVRWPRRWVGVANRGLRSINAKIVVIKGPWWIELLGLVSFLFPFSSLFSSQGMQYQVQQQQPALAKSNHRSRLGHERLEEDLSPGGDYIKLLLLPKPFSPDFRENWELYRLEYWEKENERRAQLRRQMLDHQKRLAREEGKWLWWSGWRKSATVASSSSSSQQGISASEATADAGAGKKHHRKHNPEREARARGPASRAGSHSRNTSRSSTPASLLENEERPKLSRSRRGSSNHAAATGADERHRKSKSFASVDSAAGLLKSSNFQSEASSF